MKKARKGTVLTILIMLVVVAGIAAAFFWVRKNRGKESRQEQTESCQSSRRTYARQGQNSCMLFFIQT